MYLKRIVFSPQSCGPLIPEVRNLQVPRDPAPQLVHQPYSVGGGCFSGMSGTNVVVQGRAVVTQTAGPRVEHVAHACGCLPSDTNQGGGEKWGYSLHFVAPKEGTAKASVPPKSEKFVSRKACLTPLSEAKLGPTFPPGSSKQHIEE